MGKRSRARTRAIRAEMAQTGENYTRAATAAGRSPAFRTGTDAVREHIRRVLADQLRWDQACDHRAEELERRGRRIVTGGSTSEDSWEVTDWRTGQLLAEGDGGLEGYGAAVARLDPDGTWFLVDHLYRAEPVSEVTTPGIPRSLGDAIEDWIGSTSTPDEEIAEFIGWSVEKVREHR
jgi:hypothetical protein